MKNKIIYVSMLILVIGFCAYYFLLRNRWFTIDRMALHTQVILKWQAGALDGKSLEKGLDSILDFSDSVLTESAPSHPFFVLARSPKGTSVTIVPPLKTLWETLHAHPALAHNPAFSPIAAEWLHHYGLLEEPYPTPKRSADSIRAIASRASYTYKDGVITSLVDSLWLTVGAFSKGYTVREMARYLDRHGVENYLVTGAGDMQWKGHNPSGKPWKIGVRNPRQKEAESDKPVVGVYEARDESRHGFSTSGDYERFFMKDGVRIHHLIDVSTGISTSNKMSLSITATDALEADLLATLLFILPLDSTLHFLGNSQIVLPGNVSVEGLAIDSAQVIHTSAGFKKYFTDWDKLPR